MKLVGWIGGGTPAAPASGGGGGAGRGTQGEAASRLLKCGNGGLALGQVVELLPVQRTSMRTSFDLPSPGQEL